MITRVGIKGSEMLIHFADILNSYARTLTLCESLKFEEETLDIFRSIASDMKIAAVNVQMAEETKDNCLRELVEYHNQTSSLRYIIPGITDNDFEKEWD